MTNNKQHIHDQAAPTPAERQSHQQDLIRLLAQHFNSQFYQMANNPQHGPSENLALLQSNYQPAPSSGLHHYQQPQRQFRAGQEAGMNFVTPTRLMTNLGTPPGIGQPLVSQISRSHEQPSSSGPLQAHHHQQGLPINTPNHLVCNPLFADGGLNLFNALNCFNITSDQFLLSIQQQYLLQAAAAASSSFRQLEPRQASTSNLNSAGQINATLRADPQKQLQNNRSAQSNIDLASTTGYRNDGRGPDLSSRGQTGRDLLKFSINTILGRGSPASQSADETKPSSVSPSALSIHQYLTEQHDKLVSEGKNIKGTHLTRGCELAAAVSPERDHETNSDIESVSSSATSPQPITGASHDMSIKPINNIGTLLDDDQRVGCSMNLTRHHQSASSSLNNQRPPSGDQAIDGTQQSQSNHHQTTLSFLSGSTTFPWTVAARGKPRRGMMRRAVFSDSQRVGLEKRFQLQKYISKPDRKKLAEKLGLRDSQVKIWFQNRRMKWRNSKERELLSAGGSREQTLPTRNNPNPDLSDVGETIKRLVSNSNGVGAA